MQEYDATIIGAGQGGGPLASALAKAGKRVAIVERAHAGGTCVNEGCTPTKTMIASGRVAYLARRGADYGVQSGPIAIDQGRIRQRKRDIVDSFRSGSERRLTNDDRLDLLRGQARFTGERQIEVGLENGERLELTADLIVINSGGRPALPAIDGIDRVPVLNSTSIMELDAVPRHLVVLGGGYVGLEFAQMFRRFGAAVTVVQRGSRLLGREDADVADAVAGVLLEDGIDLLLSTQTEAVEPGPDGGVRLHLATREGNRQIDASHLLAATGRQPNTDALAPDAAGVELDERGYIRVDAQLRTTAPGIYATGDVTGGPAFTHISYDDFRILRTNLIEGGSASTTDRLVPYVVYIDPQLGRVGLGEEEARVSGRTIRVAKMPMSSVARALETDESRGMMKAVVDAETDQILGCAILGIEGGEVMSLLQVVMMGKVTASALREGVFAHPSLAESVNNLFATLSD